MKLTFETPENPNSKTLTLEAPTGLWRFNEQRLDDGRCLTTITLIHGEKEDLGELAHHLPSAAKAEYDINHGVRGVEEEKK
jgi:hypothetical protein